ncbi:MAG: hypothetical protein J3R72DRAFT_93308 [Linnemannia gamsii]|nr:MAG: hypothetical protein J3R72DRAFT_93308 [Linnemannia gamsii]
MAGRCFVRLSWCKSIWRRLKIARRETTFSNNALPCLVCLLGFVLFVCVMREMRWKEGRQKELREGHRRREKVFFLHGSQNKMTFEANRATMRHEGGEIERTGRHALFFLPLSCLWGMVESVVCALFCCCCRC